MTAKAVVAAVDWGMTRIRSWLLDDSGQAIAGYRSDDGLTAARAAGFPAVLESHLALLGAPQHLPVVICGMAGAREGWIEAPYIDVPSAIGTILKGTVRVP